MRAAIFAVMMPLAAFAQDFGAVPELVEDGVTADADQMHTCVQTQVALGPQALVSLAARECIGRVAQPCEATRETCAALERSYWEWRIAQTYLGLQAWVADASGADDALRRSVENPASATVNVPLECQLRLGQGGASVSAASLADCKLRETALIALELEYTVREACEDAQGSAFAAYCAAGRVD